jgi:heat shock protein HspQ
MGSRGVDHNVRRASELTFLSFLAHSAMGTVMRTGMGTGTGTGLGTAMCTMREAKFSVGQVVRHRFYPFRGVVFDIDPEFDNTEEWWLAIPEDIRPDKNQPYYHLLAENSETEYIAYVSEQNLLADETGKPVRHPQVSELFAEDENGVYKALYLQSH